MTSGQRGDVVGVTPGPRQQQVMLELEQPGWRVVARPSGTEPKIKFYLFGYAEPERCRSEADLAAAREEATRTMDRLSADLDSFVNQAAG